MDRIGIDLGGTKIEAALLAHTGEITIRKRVATPQTYDDKLKAIASLVQAIESEHGRTGLNTGLGHPGSLNPRTGLMRNANSTDLNGKSLDHDVSAILNRTVNCANDANCFALSEAKDGAAAGAHSVFGVIIGTGVGGGLVLNGQLIEGQDGNAGEWGHTALPRLNRDELPGPDCKCGRKGCVEAWCSGPALAADHARINNETLTAEIIAERAQNGDTPCQASLDRHVDRLGRALSSVVNIFDPDVIVLGGGLSNLPDMAKRVETALYPHVFTDEPRTRIVKNLHGDSSGVRGAAWLWPLDEREP